MILVKSESEFREYIKKDRVLVDFYADWCNPCKMMDMIFEDFHDIEIVKVDIDRFRGIAKEYKVMSIPNLKIFSNGDVIKEAVGFMNRDEFSKFIND